MRYAFFILMLIITFSCKGKNALPLKDTTSKSTDPSGAYLDLSHAMDALVNRMKSIQFTGDIDKDCALYLTEYYSGANDMARIQLSGGKQKELQEFSQITITQSNRELRLLANFFKNEPSKQSSNAVTYQSEVRGALRRMTYKNILTETDVDRLFVLLLRIHHEMGLQMLHAELKYGSHQTMKIRARIMLARQSEELRWLQKWLLRN